MTVFIFFKIVEVGFYRISELWSFSHDDVITVAIWTRIRQVVLCDGHRLSIEMKEIVG